MSVTASAGFVRLLVDLGPRGITQLGALLCGRTVFIWVTHLVLVAPECHATPRLCRG